jgi:hypothetical protein
VGRLEIQLLSSDRAAHRFFEIDPDRGGVHESGSTVVHVAPGLADALPGVSRLTPLMVSLDYLLSQATPSAFGQEYFTVEVRLASPVRFPVDGLEDGPQRFDIIELSCGEMEFAAMIAHDAGWPHVTVHRAHPRSCSFEAAFPPAMERAFFAALRDAVRPLVMPPASGSAA